jgi:hypothetical protein
VAAVVDLYRMRWTIEEYFFEKLQLESARSLVMALAVLSAVAWRLLLVRWMERQQPQTPASLVVTPIQPALLAHNQRKIIGHGPPTPLPLAATPCSPSPHWADTSETTVHRAGSYLDAVFTPCC